MYSDAVSGVLIVDKPKGMTSHDVVASVRRRFGLKKVGHAGTLDPMATGVLVLLVGRATKLSSSLVLDDKEYEGTLRLGKRTRTGDSEGETIETHDVPPLSEMSVREAFGSFSGMIAQVPPMFSALKKDGRKLYELARSGVEVERAPRNVTILSIDVKEVRMPDISFSVSCSKGTYIRTLADDIGQRLGCGAHLIALRRSRSGNFTIESAVPFDKLMKLEVNDLADLLSS